MHIEIIKYYRKNFDILELLLAIFCMKRGACRLGRSEIASKHKAINKIVHPIKIPIFCQYSAFQNGDGV